jgi:hypothetical protein
MKFYLYLFYYIKSFYNYKKETDRNIHAFIVFGAILIVNLFSLFILLATVINFDFWEYRIENRFIMRFIITPILISPIYGFIFFFYRKNMPQIIGYFKQFDREDNLSKKLNRRNALLYIIVSIIFMFFSVIFPALLNEIK